MKLETEITVATSKMLKEAMEIAETVEARLVLVEVDTPGGEINAVKEIMGLFETSTIPVCLFVHPLGAAAWSGGTYLLVSAHIAAMASGTSIGSAQPITQAGEPINDTKRINALTALMVNHARLHDRNTTAARLFVVENLNLGPEEAVRYNVVDLIADDSSTLLRRLSERSLVKVQTDEGTSVWKLVPSKEAGQYAASVRVPFAGIDEAEMFDYEPGAFNWFLQIMFNPLVSSLMFTLGFFLVLIGIQTPGFGAEFVGGLLLLLSLMSIQVIGIEPTTLLLFAVGFALIVGELTTNIGFLGLAGAACIAIGSILMFPSTQWLLTPEVYNTIRNTLIATSAFLCLFFGFIGYKVTQARRLAARTGPETVEGSEGFVTIKLDPFGEVRVGGEFWRARSEDGEIERGTEIVVTSREDLVLIVKEAKPSASTQTGSQSTRR